MIGRHGRDEAVAQQLIRAGFAIPNYQGGTLASVPATAAALLEVPFAGLPPVGQELWQPLSGDVRNVVVLLIDGMGANLLAREAELFSRSITAPTVRGQLTSIFPSTTVAALSSLWTGVSPAQHGLVGLNLLLPDVATMMFVLSFSPRSGGTADDLADAGINPETFLQHPGVGQQLTAEGVHVHSFNASELLDTPLSRMFARGVSGQTGSSDLTEMMGQIRKRLERSQSGKSLMIGYWPRVDTLSHYHGWDSAEAAVELGNVLTTIQDELFDQLSAEAREGTVVLMLADHGQTLIPRSKHIYLEAHPELHKMLLLRPAGEFRVPYLYARQGGVEDVLGYFDRNLSDEFLALESRDALAAGLFGPPPFADETELRLGDITVLSRDGYVLVTESERWLAEKLEGMHAGMTPAEMQIPWLGWRLG